ncbi:uncharacterized protein LOC143886611 isoform X2 [Tasmannia lanceolata]|uniref:uncharacterized protein LOC143886611 isoform X2 n=1 Tax=Tasmannia lanceolata TaxID=3420 RepID=UPI0040643166
MIVGITATFQREGGELDAGTETNANLNHELYYHFLGTDQSQDILCWRDAEHPKWMFGAEVTEDGKKKLPFLEGSFNLRLSDKGRWQAR